MEQCITKVIRIAQYGCFLSICLYGFVGAAEKYQKYGFIVRIKKISGGLTVEKIRLYARSHTQSKEYIVRNGHFIRHKKARATIIISHGFMCNRHDIQFLRWLFRDYNVLFFDYRAHGENIDDQDCTFGKDEINELISAIKFVKHHPEIRNKPIFVYGFSMGAVTAIEAQAQKPLVDGLILDCPFDSTENIIKTGLSNMKFSFFGYEFDVPGRSYLEKYVFHPYVQSLVKLVLKAVAGMDTRNIRTRIYPLHPVESIKRVTVPCLFIYCKKDNRISPQAVQAIYANAPGYKILWETHGRGHYDSFFYNPEKYHKVVSDFLHSVLHKQYMQQPQETFIQDTDEDLI